MTTTQHIILDDVDLNHRSQVDFVQFEDGTAVLYLFSMKIYGTVGQLQDLCSRALAVIEAGDDR